MLYPGVPPVIEAGLIDAAPVHCPLQLILEEVIAAELGPFELLNGIVTVFVQLFKSLTTIV
jgi:hypothetical protein